MRQVLEEVLGIGPARAALFEALSAWGPNIPRSRDELMAFVRAPLGRALARRLAREACIDSMVQIENVLAIVEADDDLGPTPRPSSRPPPPSSATSTWALRPIRPGPVPVLVFSANPSLGHVLELAIGKNDIAPTMSRDAAGLAAAATGAVEVVLLDAVEPQLVEPIVVARALEGVPKRVWLTVWGAEGPFGRDLAQILVACGLQCVPLLSTEGLEPFVDLVRARRA